MTHRINAHGTEVTDPTALADTQYVPLDGAAGSQRMSIINIAQALAMRPLRTLTKTANYTLVLTDQSADIEMNVATANNLTVPPNSSVAFPIGTTIPVASIGAGQTTIVAGAGVTIQSRGGALKLFGQWSEGTLRKRATDVWVFSGDITT